MLGSRSSVVIPEVFWSALWVYKEIKQHNQFDQAPVILITVKDVNGMFLC